MRRLVLYVVPRRWRRQHSNYSLPLNTRVYCLAAGLGVVLGSRPKVAPSIIIQLWRLYTVDDEAVGHI
jgi:hypothetical protein